MMKAGLNKVRMPRVLIPKVHLPYVGWHSDLSGDPMWRKLKKDMVLWYDLKRQGATNENMASNPTLRDLSGNGHNATCYNFAWSGMSGIGGYYFHTLHAGIDRYANYELSSDGSKITVLSNKVQASTIQTFINDIEIGKSYHYKIRVTGLDEFNKTHPNTVIYNSNDSALNITEDGDYEIENVSIYQYVTCTILSQTSIPVNTQINITIEQLPLYPNALVSDGVDDYCLVEGLPLLNKEDGYTVIAKRKWLTEDLTVESLQDKCFLSDMPDGGEPYGGAYAIELNLSSGCNAQSCGKRTIVNISEDDIVYQTSKSYCGQNIETSSDFVEGNGLFKLFRFGNGYRAPIALNSTLLFNRDLSTDEIEWVKTNLMS